MRRWACRFLFWQFSHHPSGHEKLPVVTREILHGRCLHQFRMCFVALFSSILISKWFTEATNCGWGVSYFGRCFTSERGELRNLLIIVFSGPMFTDLRPYALVIRCYRQSWKRIFKQYKFFMCFTGLSSHWNDHYMHYFRVVCLWMPCLFITKDYLIIEWQWIIMITLD